MTSSQGTGASSAPAPPGPMTGAEFQLLFAGYAPSRPGGQPTGGVR